MPTRLGSEEFCILMPMTDEAWAANFDKRLRVAVAASAQGRLDRAPGFSTGLVCLRDDDTLDTLTRRADASTSDNSLSDRQRSPFP
nr:diguanylate cyclase [Propionivibrio soli]